MDAILKNKNSITAKFLSGKRKIKIPKKRTKANKEQIKIIDASENNLKKISVDIPVGLFTCITGVSGSGKSSLAFESTLQVRNKVLKAYDDIMNMPV